MRAVLKNGTDYTLIRIQPRSTNEMVIDMNTGEMYEKNPTKKIAPAYYDVYSKIWDKEYDNITINYSGAERKKHIAALDRKVADAMEEWLSKNALKYGYQFVKE
jgi:hypothetical protein